MNSEQRFTSSLVDVKPEPPRPPMLVFKLSRLDSDGLVFLQVRKAGGSWQNIASISTFDGCLLLHERLDTTMGLQVNRRGMIRLYPDDIEKGQV